MRTAAIVVLTLILCLHAHAAGMTDYTLKIDETHSIFRVNGFDIMVGRTDGSFYREFCHDQSASGPLREIYWDKDFIFLKHAGRKQRHAFPGDRYIEADDTTNVYYTLRRHADTIAGPFDLDAFTNHLASTGYPSSIPWRPLAKVHEESLRQNPPHLGVWDRVVAATYLISGLLLACTICYTVISCPALVLLVIVRGVRRRNWDIMKWWWRGLAGACCLAVVVAVVWGVAYAGT